MRIDFNISQSELGNFVNACETVIRNVGAGSKAATEYAGWEIMSDSLGQVPVDTGTLISSAFLGVSNRSDVKSYVYGAVLGYGDVRGLSQQMGLDGISWLMAPTNGTNPKNGLPASAYASRVHEDLAMPHPNGGKAKFLEDPVRNWASGKFARTAMTYWKRAIVWTRHNFNYVAQYRGGDNVRFKHRPYTSYDTKFNVHRKGTQRGGSSVYKGESQ